MKAFSNILADRPHGAARHVSVFGLQFMQASMGLGVACFAFFVLAMHLTGAFTQEHAGPGDEQIVRRLSDLILGALAVVYVLACVMPGFLRRRKEGEAPPTIAADEAGRQAQFDAFLRRFLGTRHLRLALLEGAALGGLVVCLVAEILNVLGDRPAYWLFYLPSGIFAVYVVASFPTRRRLEARFEDHLEWLRRAG